MQVKSAAQGVTVVLSGHATDESTGDLGVLSDVFMCSMTCLCCGVRHSRGRKMLCIGPW